jgi:hypothetical protein
MISSACSNSEDGIVRLRAFAVLSYRARPVRQESSRLGVLSEQVDAWPMLHRQVSGLLPARPGHRAREDQKCARAASGHCGEGALDVGGNAYVREYDRHGELPRRRLDRPRLCAGTADLTENTDAVELRDGVVQRFQLLCDELRALSQARARNVPARPREAGTALLGLPDVTIASGLSPTRLAASSSS